MRRSTADTTGEPTAGRSRPPDVTWTWAERQTAAMATRMPDDWQRALVVAAHPDDIEYGMSAAVPAWGAAGKGGHYLLAPRGEAGMGGARRGGARARRAGVRGRGRAPGRGAH